jgi:hypothetical protein
VRRAATDDTLVDGAAELNWRSVTERLDERRLKAQAIALYDQIFADLAHKEQAA